MEIVTKEIETLLVFACRYCHNRQTGGAMVAVNAVLNHWNQITPITQELLAREAKIGATCNIDDWCRLIDRYESEYKTIT